MSTDEFCTPPEVADPLEQFFEGPVDLDPCGNPRSIIRAREAYHGKVGLALPWFSKHRRTVYENPPYSKMDAFTDKGILEMHDHADEGPLELVRLVMGTPSTAWWRRAIGKEPVVRPAKGARGKVEVLAWKPTLIFTRRLTFIGEESSARFESTLFYYGRRPDRFVREFKAITSWVP